MKKKNERFDRHIDANGKNWLQVNEDYVILSPTKKIQVKIHNHEKKLTGRYDQIKGDHVSDSAEIILKFVAKKSADEHVNEKEEVKYYLASEPKNDKELEKFKRQAHQQYIIDNKLISEPNDQGEDITWTITRGNNEQIELEITKQNDPNAARKIIKSDQLKIDAEFYLVDKVTLDDVMDYPPPEKEKSR
ncbi:MAG: hypothetical protein NY202_02270 [Mollicutes bacterium UO1]